MFDVVLYLQHWRKAMLNNTLLVTELLEKYFSEVLCYTLDLSGTVFPEKEGFSSYMAAPQDLDEDEIFKNITAYFKIGFDAYSSSITGSIKRCFDQTRPRGLYVFAHRGGDEPELEYRNKSYDDVADTRVLFLNAKEYLLVTGFHRWTKGYFMDIKGWTRTSSLQSTRQLFRGCWDQKSNQLCFHRSRRGCRYPSNGLRELVLAT